MIDRMKNPFPPQSAEAFFFAHCAYSYGPNETRKQGRMRSATDLARAEEHARNNDWEFLWDSDWDVGSHKKFYGYEKEPDTCEYCQLRDADDKVLGSLGCIDDADANYRRVVQAELASEAMHNQIRELLQEFELNAFVNRCYAL